MAIGLKSSGMTGVSTFGIGQILEIFNGLGKSWRSMHEFNIWVIGDAKISAQCLMNLTGKLSGPVDVSFRSSPSSFSTSLYVTGRRLKPLFLQGKDLIPEPTARSAVPGVSPGRGLLIPHGYLHPGKCEDSEVLRSAKFINDCGRITLAHRWTSLISNIWRTARSGKGKDPKKNI